MLGASSGNVNMFWSDHVLARPDRLGNSHKLAALNSSFSEPLAKTQGLYKYEFWPLRPCDGNPAVDKLTSRAHMLLRPAPQVP